MPMTGDVAIAVEDDVAVLRLRNPARRNAISAPMWHTIAEFARGVGARMDVRAIIVRGDGVKAFCAGADISSFEQSRAEASDARRYDDLIEDTCRLIEAIPQPTIAFIRGACMGAGASLAASCDLRVAAADAFFAVPAARLGLGYDPRGVARYMRVFGAGLSRHMLYSARRVSAERAYVLGAVHELAPGDEADVLAYSLARDIAANAPITIRAAKASIRAHISGDRDLMSEADRLYAAADASGDYAEGRRAFAEKRLPHFTGS